MVQNSFKKSEIIQGDINDDAQSNLTSDPDWFLDNDDNDADDFMSDAPNLSPELLKFFNSVLSMKILMDFLMFSEII